MMIREKSSRSRCGEFEVPIICAAGSCRNFKFENRTRIIKLLVPLLIPKFASEVPRVLANFGIGALAAFARAQRALKQGRHLADRKWPEQYPSVDEPNRQRCRRLAVEFAALAEHRNQSRRRAPACDAAEPRHQLVEGIERGAHLAFRHEPLQVKYFEKFFDPDNCDPQISIEAPARGESHSAGADRNDVVLPDARFGDFDFAVVGLPLPELIRQGLPREAVEAVHNACDISIDWPCERGMDFPRNGILDLQDGLHRWLV